MHLTMESCYKQIIAGHKIINNTPQDIDNIKSLIAWVDSCKSSTDDGKIPEQYHELFRDCYRYAKGLEHFVVATGRYDVLNYSTSNFRKFIFLSFLESSKTIEDITAISYLWKFLNEKDDNIQPGMLDSIAKLYPRVIEDNVGVVYYNSKYSYMPYYTLVA